MDENERIPIGNNIISINNQNLEEAEELEDRKRREEEIHNLLSNAMGEFNFDDQSTFNSSIASKEGDDSILPIQTQTAFDEQYREANADEQLKVLYEVRVREVVALNREVERLTAEFDKQEQVLKKKATLLEIENERKNISLKEAQDLLVDKTEQIKNLSGQLQNTEATIKHLEANISEFNQETLILREANMKLEQQLILMERGFPLYHQTSDKELRESQRNKITQLENSLERTVEKIERKERQHKELVRELRQSLQQKDDCLAEKCALINKLTANFDTAQERCQELLRTVEELRQVQKAADCTQSPLEEELRKIREYNERTDILCENVRKVVSEEFQSQIAALNSENNLLKEKLHGQENDFEKVKQELQALSSIKSEREILQIKLKELQNKFDDVNVHTDSITQKLAEYKKDRDSLKEKCKQLTMDNESLVNSLEEKYKQMKMDNETLVNVKMDNENLQKQILDLQIYINEVVNPTTTEKSVQASFSFANSTEIENLNKEKEGIYDKLVASHAAIDKFETKIQLLLQENAQLKERESLIKKLQDKAAQFEKIIFEKQKKLTKVKTASIGTNTETYQDNNSLLKVKYDALLYQTETNLRKNLKQEFDAKLEKLAHEAQQNIKTHVCKECSGLKNENKKLHELRMQDRQSVMKLVDNWTEKFTELEKESQHSMAELKAVCDRQLISHAIKLEQEYVDKFKKIGEHLKQKTISEVERQKDKLVHSSLRRHNLLNERLNRIITKIQQGSEEIAAIEKQSLKDKATFEKK